MMEGAFILRLYIIYKKNTPPTNIVSTPFLYLAKKSPPFPSDFPTKRKKKLVTNPSPLSLVVNNAC